MSQDQVMLVFSSQNKQLFGAKNKAQNHLETSSAIVGLPGWGKFVLLLLCDWEFGGGVTLAMHEEKF